VYSIFAKHSHDLRHQRRPRTGFIKHGFNPKALASLRSWSKPIAFRERVISKQDSPRPRFIPGFGQADHAAIDRIRSWAQ